MIDNVYAHWCLNQSSGTNVPDSSGNNRHGIAENILNSNWIVGKLSNCLSLNLGEDQDECVNCGDIANWNGGFSLECWFKTSTIAIKTLLSRFQILSIYLSGYRLDIISGHIAFRAQNSAGGNGEYWEVQTDNTYNDNAWHHVVATYTAETTKIYVDGISRTLTVNSDNLNGSIFTNCTFYIGSWSGYANFVGLIDEVVLYSDILTQDEVTYRFNNGYGRENMGLPTNKIFSIGDNYLFQVDESTFEEEYAWNIGSTPLFLSADDTYLWMASYSKILKGDLTANPYGVWHLNASSGTTVTDSSGNGRNGVATNMEDADWQAGKLNNCLVFEGTNEHVDLGNIAPFERDEQFSIEFWINAGASCGNPSHIIAKLGNSAPISGWAVRFSSGKIELVLSYSFGDNNLLRMRTQSTFNDDAWHHVIVTYAGTSAPSGVKIYVDSVSQTLDTVTNGLSGSIQTSVNLRFGTRDALGYPLIGKLDEVLLYYHVLSQAEVNTRYASGNGTETFSTSVEFIPHILASNKDVRGMSQDTNYVYVTTSLNIAGTVWTPRVIRISKTDWSESYIDLTVTGSYAGRIAGCIVDGTTLWACGNNNAVEHGDSDIGSLVLWKIDLTTFTQSGFYKYDPYPTNRGYEDFKLFTEVDPSTRISVPTHNYLDFVASTSEDTRLYRDYGEYPPDNPYFTDPSHKFKVTIDSADIGAIVFPWFLSNDLDDEEWLKTNNKSAYGLRVDCTDTGIITFKIEELYGGTRYLTDAITGSVGTTYYIKMMKKWNPTTTVYLEIFSSQALLDASGGKMAGIGTGNIGSLSLTLHADIRCQYLLIGQTSNVGTNKLCTIKIENITFEQLEQPLYFTEATYDSSYVYCFAKSGLCLKILKNLASSSVVYIYPLGTQSGGGILGTGTSHLPLNRPFFEDTDWHDIYWVTDCTMKHILKIRTGVFGIERHLAEPDGDWTSLKSSVGTGLGETLALYVGSGNKNSIKKIELVLDMSVVSTLNLSVAGSGITSIWCT